MQRFRELLAHGGIVVLALVFALAILAFEVANEIANVLISILVQRLVDEDGGDPLGLTIADTEIHYGTTLGFAIALLLLLAAVYALWRLGRGSIRTCPECRSTIPAHASVCRYCSSELAGVGADA